MTTSGNGHLVDGVVEVVNDRGIKVGGEWLNLSRFKPLDLPIAGAHVRVETDSKGFIKSLEVLEPGPLGVARDQTITRLAVLKAAAAFCGAYATAHAEVKSSDVLKIAQVWLAWVEQPQPSSSQEAF